MSFPRLGAFPLLAVLCLPLVTAGCGLPLAVSAVSYGADGAALVKTGKTGSDHLISMVSKQDCAMWRIVKNKPICKDREEGSKDPYDVDYTTPEKTQSEDGVSYIAPPRPPAGAPASSWDAAVYKQEPTADPKPEPTSAVADQAADSPTIAPAPLPAAPAVTPPPRKKGHTARPTPKAKKLSQGSAASRS